MLRYYHTADRCMALGSALLKRLAITSLVPTEPFRTIQVGRDTPQAKPTHRPLSPSTHAVQFNVSHQAGLVVLVARYDVSSRGHLGVGIDVVCTAERDDATKVAAAGSFTAWLADYAEVFSAREIADLQAPLPDGSTAAALLRRFYALWALREAYVKLSGEALLAPWLRQLEFRDLRAPPPVKEGAWSSDEERVRSVEVWRGRERVRDVAVELCAFGRDYMVATAVQVDPDDEHVDGGVELRAFDEVDSETIERVAWAGI